MTLKLRAILTLLVTALCALYAAPSFYARLPALEVSGASDTQSALPSAESLKSTLSAAGAPPHTPEWDKDETKWILTFDTPEAREAALHALEVHDPSLSLTLSSKSTAPAWLKSIGGKPIRLGLDLQGGVMFLLKVDTQAAVSSQIQSLKNLWLSDLGAQGIFPKSEAGRFQFASSTELQSAKTSAENYFRLSEFTLSQEGLSLALTPKDNFVSRIEESAVGQNLLALKNRINELGVAEPVIRRQGEDHILIQLPGIQDPTRAKKIIGTTATLSFHLEADGRTSSLETLERPMRESGAPVQLLAEEIASGDNITDASASLDRNSLPEVNITLNALGGKRMADITQKNIGRRMAVLFSETESQAPESTKGATLTPQAPPKVRSEVISLATIQGAFSNQFRITGLSNLKEANTLALLLRAGSLSSPVYFEQEQVIGPSLGADNIRAGLVAALAGFVFVLVIALLAYRAFGLASSLGLVLNLMMTLAIMSQLGATLTLSGIAGLVLNLGMAIDANVLNFSRVKEEIERTHMSMKHALTQGFKNSFSAIFDSHITTLLTAFTLYSIASGSVKGFAVTLAIGVLGSLFSALIAARFLVELFTKIARAEHKPYPPFYLL